MTGGKRHLLQLGDVPSRDDDASRVGINAQRVDNGLDLVDVVPVGCRPGTPLHPVDRAEFAALVSPLVPDGHSVVTEPFHVGLAAQEPQEFIGDRFEVDALGRDKGEPF